MVPTITPLVIIISNSFLFFIFSIYFSLSSFSLFAFLFNEKRCEYPFTLFCFLFRPLFSRNTNFLLFFFSSLLKKVEHSFYFTTLYIKKNQDLFLPTFPFLSFFLSYKYPTRERRKKCWSLKHFMVISKQRKMFY